MPLNDLAPSHRERLRDDAVKLRDLLRGIRGAKTDARDFALFDVRDQLAGLGVDRGQIDAFDAHDDDALDDRIGQAHAVATALGAEDDTDHSTVFGDSGQDVLVGGMGADTINTAATAPSIWENAVRTGHALASEAGAAYGRIASSAAKADRLGREESRRAAESAKAGGLRDAHNNGYDAERHARWTYRMAKELSPAEATIYGAGHEMDNLYHWAFPREAQKRQARIPLGQQLKENLMDLHNNGVGVGQAAANGGPPDLKTPGLRWFRGTGDR